MAKRTIQNNVFTFIDTFKSNLDILSSEIESWNKSLNKKDAIDFPVRYNIGKDDEYKVEYNNLEKANRILKIGTEFLDSFKLYVGSDNCTGSKLEKMIVELKLKNTDDSKIEEVLNIAPSTFRTCIARFTKKVNKAIWGSSPIPNELLYLKEATVFKSYTKKVKVASVRYDFENILPYNFLALIKAKCNDCESMEKYDVLSEEYYKAFRLVTMFSLATFEEELEKVDKYALQFVLDALNRKGDNITSANFKTVMSNPSQWLMSSPADFRNMLVENKSLFPEDEEPNKKLREKKKAKSDSIVKEPQEQVEFDDGVTIGVVSNSQYDLPITEEMANLLTKKLEEFRSLGETNPKYGEICNTGYSDIEENKVYKCFNNPKLSTLSPEQFGEVLDRLNPYAIELYLKNKK